MKKKEFFGISQSEDTVSIYTIGNDDCSLTVSDRGATVVSFKVFGRDIVGGFDTLEGYLTDDSHQGGTIGRVANRIANAKFVMDGKSYSLTDNDNGNCLHGGSGFDSKMWELVSHSDDRIVLSYLSEDGEDGFPANLKVNVSFSVKDTAVIIEYTAVPDAKTPIALTNHSYFNLDGFGGDIKEHTAVIYAENYTEVSKSLIPNGQTPCVKGTVFDFSEPHKIGERIGGDFIGYDHNFILSPQQYKEFSGKSLGLAAEVWNSDLKMNVYTDQPGIQFYIGNFLGKGPDFKGGVPQIRHGAFCLETQTEPNCINHGKAFFERDEIYSHICVYSIEKIANVKIFL